MILVVKKVEPKGWVSKMFEKPKENGFVTNSFKFSQTPLDAVFCRVTILFKKSPQVTNFYKVQEHHPKARKLMRGHMSVVRNHRHQVPKGLMLSE